jgi:hypothetical protein
VFSVKLDNTEPIIVMLMGSLKPPNAHIIATFDIKGSVKDRVVSKLVPLTFETIEAGEVYKDIDF